MPIIKSKTPLAEIWNNRQVETRDLLKIVVDITRKCIAVDAEMHADLEDLLLEDGSRQEDLWGANLYPEKHGIDFIEYTSFINIRPSQGNRSMEIQDEGIRDRVAGVIRELFNTN